MAKGSGAPKPTRTNKGIRHVSGSTSTVKVGKPRGGTQHGNGSVKC